MPLWELRHYDVKVETPPLPGLLIMLLTSRIRSSGIAEPWSDMLLECHTPDICRKPLASGLFSQ